MQSSRSLRSSSSSIPIDRQRKISTTNRSKHKQLSSLVKKSQSTSTSDTETALLISNANCNITHVLCSNPNSYENLLRQDLTFESNRQRIILNVMKYLEQLDSPMIPFSPVSGLYPSALVCLLHGPYGTQRWTRSFCS
ncbi:hypothetical protein RCL1_008689 [Eukaryota sp. TZLM3-RCL]